MPVYPACFLIPDHEAVTSVSFEAGEAVALEGAYSIRPMPPQVPLGSRARALRAERSDIYGSTSPHPAVRGSAVTEQVAAGFHVLFVNIYPCSVIPSTGRVTFYRSVTVTIETEPGPVRNSLPPRAQRKRGLRLLERMVENGDVASLSGSPGSLLHESESAGDVIPYVIITSSGLAPDFQALSDLKTLLGFHCEIFDLDWITSQFPGSDTQEQIRNFIIHAYENYGTEYVLLGGDEEIIPHRGMYVKAGTEIEPDIPADIYYSALDGNWNTDGDAYFGEPGEEDLLPEIAVGRLPVDSSVEIANFTSKLTAYSTSPPQNQSSTSIMLGELLWSIEGVDTWGGDYKDEILNGTSNFSFTTEGFPPHFTSQTLYDRDLSPDWTSADLLTYLNVGVHIINHMGHANLFQVMRLTTSDLALLENDGLDATFFFCYSQGCYSASFDNRDDAGTVYPDDAIGEELITSPAGAVAFIGNTRLGWAAPGTTCGVSQFFDRQFFDALFGENLYTIGEAFNDSRIDNIAFIAYPLVRYAMYELCLFGDPSMQIWTDEPTELIAIQDSTLPIGEHTYMVEVRDTDGPVEGARTTIFCEDLNLCATEITDNRGIAMFETNAMEESEILLSIQAQNHFPYIDTITTADISSALPELAFVKIDDDTEGMSMGDGDGVAENGERIELDIIIKNNGDDTANEMVVKLDCPNSSISLLEDSCYVGTFPRRCATILEDAFAMQIADQVPDGSDVQLQFHIQALEGEWEQAYNFTANAPNLVLLEWGVTDTLRGNGNNCVEPWEHLNVFSSWTNTGNKDIASAHLTLSFPEGSWSTATKFHTEPTTINAGDTVRFENELECYINPSTPYFSDIPLYLTFSGENIPAKAETLSIRSCGYGLFDAVDSEGPWSHEGITGIDSWYTDGQQYYSPSLSWKCGGGPGKPYPNMVDAVLVSPPLCLYDNSIMTFYHKIEAEADDYYPYWARDAGVVEISTDDGTTWSIINPVGSYPARASANNTIFLSAYQRCYSGTSDWALAQFDLSSYSGCVQLRFHFASDEQYGFDGWIIDDISIDTDLPTGEIDDDTPDSRFVNSLKPAYPNPFNPVTTIPFEIASRARVDIGIFDVTGKRIATLVDRVLDGGSYTTVWKGKSSSGARVASGLYFCRLKAGSYSATQKLTLIR